MRLAKWIGITAGALIAVVVLFLALFDWNLLRGRVERLAASRLARPVHIARLHVVPLRLHPYAEVDGLEIGNPAWAGGGLMASARRVMVQIALPSLLAGNLVLTRVELSDPDFYLFRGADGRANWLFGEPSGHATGPPQKRDRPARLPLVHQLFIDSGRLRLIDREQELFFAGGFGAAQGRPAQRGRPVEQGQRGGGSVGTQPFSLSGKGRLNRRPFTLEVTGGPLIWAETHKPYPYDVRVVASDIHASAHGIVPNPFDLGRLSVTAAVSGNDLADLYYLTGLALPNSHPYQLSGHLERTGSHFEFTNVEGRLGRSDLGGSVSIDMVSERPRVSATLLSHALYLADLAPIFGTTVTPEAQKWLLPRARLDLERFRGMDADVRYRAERIEAHGLPVRSADVHVDLDHGLLRLDPFSFTLPEGTVAGVTSLDARHDIPLTHIDLRLRHIHLSEFRTAALEQPPLSGVLVGRIDLDGHGDSVHAFASTADGTVSAVLPNGDVDQAFVELAGIDVARGLGLLLTDKNKQVPVRCGIADFTARSGVLRVQNMVLDTQTVLITGKGDVNLKRERLDLDVSGHPKRFRFFRLKTPIAISGTLRKPSIGLKPGSAPVQAGAAAILGALATPFAAIAAFVDPGLAKDADCRSLIDEAKSKGAPVRTASSANAAAQ